MAGNPGWKKGQSGNPKGKPKGVENKMTRDVREMILRVHAGCGGYKWTMAWAKENPTEFHRIWSKLLPTRVEGADGEPLVLLREYRGKEFRQEDHGEAKVDGASS